MEWAVTHMISDDPAQGLGRAAPDKLFPQQLKDVIGEPSSHLEMVIAYFVPTQAGVDSLVSMAKRGVKIRIVTNSLEATGGPYVHAGYAKRRKALLEAGITLYELRRLSPKPKRERGSGSARQLRLQSARQDIRGGRQPHFRRLIQLRSAFGEVEHRAWFRHREPSPRTADRRNIRYDRSGARLSSSLVGERRDLLDRALG